MADHPFQVKVQLTAEEYVGMTAVVDFIGTSQSGLLRMLLKEKIRAHADTMRSPADKSTDEAG